MVVDDGTCSSKVDVQDIDCMDESKTHVRINQSIWFMMSIVGIHLVDILLDKRHKLHNK